MIYGSLPQYHQKAIDFLQDDPYGIFVCLPLICLFVCVFFCEVIFIGEVIKKNMFKKIKVQVYVNQGKSLSHIKI
jgi:hypothetical protein